MNNVIIIATCVVLFASCKKEGSNPVVGGGAASSASFSVDGQSFSGTGLGLLDSAGLGIELAAAVGTQMFVIGFVTNGQPAVNTPIQLGDGATSPGWGVLFFGDTSQIYTTGPNGTSGTLTITTLSQTVVAGTSSFTASDGATTKTVSNVQFSVPLHRE